MTRRALLVALLLSATTLADKPLKRRQVPRPKPNKPPPPPVDPAPGTPQRDDVLTLPHGPLPPR